MSYVLFFAIPTLRGVWSFYLSKCSYPLHFIPYFYFSLLSIVCWCGSLHVCDGYTLTGDHY